MSRNVAGAAALLAVAACMALALATAGVASARAQDARSGGAHAAHAGADSRFAAEAAMGGMEEVELGRMAAEKGATDEVRQFGRRMVEDHSKANEELTRLAAEKGWALPSSLDAKHRADVEKLAPLAGEAFDRAYVKMMLADHKKDVGEFQRQSERGPDAELKAFATRTLPTLREHLRMIQRISDKMALRRSGHLRR